MRPSSLASCRASHCPCDKHVSLALSSTSVLISMNGVTDPSLHFGGYQLSPYCIVTSWDSLALIHCVTYNQAASRGHHALGLSSPRLGSDVAQQLPQHTVSG
eukprot:2673425-Amphidinium_carterae.1